MSSLNVELYGVLIGSLSQEHRELRFKVSPGVFEYYPVASTIMSLAVPLNLEYTIKQKKRAAGFFSELLPEGRNLRWLIQTLSIENQNTYGLLQKYGKDCAGALILYDPSDPASSKKPTATKVNSQQIRGLLERMPDEPLANSPISGKTSLGGVQGKIVLAKKNKQWRRVHYGYPSTHILKPKAPERPTMIYDEAFCMKLAYSVGLTSHSVWIEDFDGIDALVIERYDRDATVVGGRIHQEDFNQALGARGNQKYQEVGGKVSAKRIAQLLMRFGSNEDVEIFASQLVFATAIGNLDLHAKNVSVLHLPDTSIKLAPTYDQVPLRHHNTDGKMALALNGEYVHSRLTKAHLVAELLSWKSANFSCEKSVLAYVEHCLESCCLALNSLPLIDGAHPQLREMIEGFISNLLCGKPIGRISA